MAFDGIIDAITGPSFKMPDGSSKTQTLAEGARELGQAAKSELVEKTTVIVEQAKSNLKDPLLDILSNAARVIKKAVPTALAACASLQYTGGRASFASYLQPVHLRSKYLNVGTDRHTTIGYPTDRYLQLSTLSGYVMCGDVRLNIPADATKGGATLEEAQLIKQYLESGCYIE